MPQAMMHNEPVRSDNDQAIHAGKTMATVPPNCSIRSRRETTGRPFLPPSCTPAGTWGREKCPLL